MLYYLNLYLGRYVSGLDLQALRISVFQGDLELRNLRLKPEALNKLNLPITVKAGLLGSLKLKVGAHRRCARRCVNCLRRPVQRPGPHSLTGSSLGSVRGADWLTGRCHGRT